MEVVFLYQEQDYNLDFMLLGVVLGMLLGITKVGSFGSSPEGVVKTNLSRRVAAKLEKQE